MHPGDAALRNTSNARVYNAASIKAPPVYFAGERVRARPRRYIDNAHPRSRGDSDSSLLINSISWHGASDFIMRLRGARRRDIGNKHLFFRFRDGVCRTRFEISILNRATALSRQTIREIDHSIRQEYGYPYLQSCPNYEVQSSSSVEIDIVLRSWKYSDISIQIDYYSWNWLFSSNYCRSSGKNQAINNSSDHQKCVLANPRQCYKCRHVFHDYCLSALGCILLQPLFSRWSFRKLRHAPVDTPATSWIYSQTGRRATGQRC